VKNTRERLQELYGPRPEHPLKKQRAAYSVQKRNAKQRGIEWKFTFKEWWAWWQVDDRWANRGMGNDKFVMARRGDTGPYSPENVYCATHKQNHADIRPGVMSENVRKGWQTKPKPRRNGAEHYKSMAIQTPAGVFVNAVKAAEHFGITRQGVRYRITAGWGGWRYVLSETA
jgi:hypothetical protein